MFKNNVIHIHHYFANFNVDDNAYRLLLRSELKGRENDPIFPEFDPILGWTAEPVTEDNPLGIVIGRKYTLDEFKSQPAVLFFGDSFIEGLTELEDKIPQLLDEELDDILVLNFGVNGYGLDQMYLRMKSVIDLFDKPYIMIGLIHPDLNRCMYEVMHSAKPYYEISGDSLVLKGTPIPADYGQWLERYPISIASYAFAGLNGLIRRALVTRWGIKYFFKLHPSESTTRRDEKIAICRKLIEKIKQKCDGRNAPLTFVEFPDHFNMIKEGWYEVFLKKTFSDLKIDHINLKPLLKAHLESNGLKWYKDLYKLNSHPDAEENKLIAKYIASYLREGKLSTGW
jgi:hypothetical protein